MKKCLIIVIALLLISPLICNAHPGRTDKYGGHVNKETGEYHYHNSDGSVTTATNLNKSSQSSETENAEPEPQLNADNTIVNVVVDGDKKPVQKAVSENITKENNSPETETNEVVKVVTENGDTITYIPHKTLYSNITSALWILIIIMALIGWCAISPIICIILNKIESKNSALAIIFHVPYLMFWLPSLVGKQFYKLYNKLCPKKENNPDEELEQEDYDDYEI